jgi:hypothetical protein
MMKTSKQDVRGRHRAGAGGILGEWVGLHARNQLASYSRAIQHGGSGAFAGSTRLILIPHPRRRFFYGRQQTGFAEPAC